MNQRIIANFVGRILLVEAAFLLPAAGVSLYYHEGGALRALLLSAVITAAAGGALMIPRPDRRGYYAREGFVTVALAWIALSVFGALPFYISREIPHFIDCLFETVSGFTTTGASILPKVEALSRGLLYWRSFTHWLGGMGVLVFLLAVDPLGQGGGGQSVYLLRAESPGPEVGKLVPKTRHSAVILYGIYIGLTMLQMVFLRLGGMPLFDTVTVALGTAGTGGFAVRTDSMASYGPTLQWVVTVFMALFGVNFGVYYLLLSRALRQVARNEEFRLYLGVMLGAIVLIVLNIRPLYGSWGETVRHGAFQVSSIMTTTGFSTEDFDRWPEFSKTILLLLMAFGASAGSTGGGIKSARVLLMLKSLRCELGRIVSPRLVRRMRLDGRAVSESTMRGVWLYMTAYGIIAALSALAVSLNGFGIETTVSAVLACLNNIGPGLGLVGPTSCYAVFDSFTKVVLILDMLLGRLEILPLLLLCIPSVWRRGV